MKNSCVPQCTSFLVKVCFVRNSIDSAIMGHIPVDCSGKVKNVPKVEKEKKVKKEKEQAATQESAKKGKKRKADEVDPETKATTTSGSSEQDTSSEEEISETEESKKAHAEVLAEQARQKPKDPTAKPKGLASLLKE